MRVHPNWTEPGGGVNSVGLSLCERVLFVAQKLQLILVLGEESLKSQVFADDGQNLPQQLPFTKPLNRRETNGAAELIFTKTFKKKKTTKNTFSSC